jgi:hypothetical protein
MVSRCAPAPCSAPTPPRPGHVLRVWSRRHRDLGRAKNQAACRLHAVLCELVPGGVPEEITAAQAARILGRVTPSGVAGQARTGLAADLLADMRRLDEQMREPKKKLAAAVRASGTSLTDLFGVGPVIAATVIGDVARRGPVRHQGPLRRRQRHRPGRGVVGRPQDPPAVTGKRVEVQALREFESRILRPLTCDALRSVRALRYTPQHLSHFLSQLSPGHMPHSGQTGMTER